jgi:hypothetical protein
MEHLKTFDMTKCQTSYYPLVINVNYTSDGKQYAFMNYCVLTKDSTTNMLKGVKVVKQLILINGLPFEIKSIYGLENKEENESNG